MRRMSSVKAAQRIPEPTWNATCGGFPLEAAAIPASAKHTSAPMPKPNIRARYCRNAASATARSPSQTSLKPMM